VVSFSYRWPKEHTVHLWRCFFTGQRRNQVTLPVNSL